MKGREVVTYKGAHKTVTHVPMGIAHSHTHKTQPAAGAKPAAEKPAEEPAK